MDMKKICKQTGYFCVGASVWLAENTAKGAVIAGKATAKATRKMVDKGEVIIKNQKVASEERKRERLIAALNAAKEVEIIAAAPCN